MVITVNAFRNRDVGFIGLDAALENSLAYGRGAGVGRGLGVGAHLPMHGVGVGVGVGLAVGVGVGPDCAQYLPPVLSATAPQMIISLPVHTAVCKARALGALVVLVALQLSMLALYLPPVLNSFVVPCSNPPHTIISLPVQIAVCASRASGALVMLVGVQLFVLGIYLPPVLRLTPTPSPPQMIISLPVQTAL